MWHSACTLSESKVYIFFGFRLDNSQVRSIECWNARDELLNGVVTDRKSLWDEFLLREYDTGGCNLVPWRWNPIIVPLNDK